jgi:hypothetical protein
MSSWHTKFSRIAPPDEVALRMRISRDRFSCDEDGANGQLPSVDPPEGKLKDELISCLKLILQFPEIPATQRDRINGITLKAGSMLRKELRELGLISEVNVNPGVRGKNFKEVRLTQKAEDLLG